MESPVVNPRVSDVTVIEMFKFINIQHQDYESLCNRKISKEKAIEEILRLFKKDLESIQNEISKEEEEKKKEEKNPKKVNFFEGLSKLVQEIQNKDNPVAEEIKSEEIQSKFVNMENITEKQNYVKEKLSNQRKVLEIYQIVKKIIDASDENMTILNLFILMTESTFAILKIHRLEFEVLESSSKKEIYVKIKSSQENIINQAKKMQYKLKLKKQPEWVHDFQKHSLNMPLNHILIYNQKTTFVNYDKNGKEVDNGSLLTFNDKYIIINSMLAENIDLSVLISNGLMLDRFILHQKDSIKELKQKWAGFSSFMKPMPSNLIKTYFSEQIALYFNFLHLLKDFIKVLAILGLIIYISRIINHYFIKSNHIIVLYHFYCVFLIIWGLAFNKAFERKEKELAWEWGTLDFADNQIQRQEFKGTYKIDEPTGRMKIINEHQFLYFLIRVASFIGSGSFMMLGILTNISIPAFFYYLTGVKYASEEYANSKGYQLLGGIMYGVQINVFNIAYNIIARKLTNAENHETIQEYNSSLILKLFIFRFVNSYFNLFEIAFLKEKEKCQRHSCMSELGYRLMVIFSISLVFNFIEIGKPWVKYWIRIKKTFGSFSLKNLNKKDEDIKIKLESLLEPYDNTINDYMEICTMFGYIALFGASHHLLGILAFIALFLESRIDSLKLCTIIRRPEPIKTNSIGVWKKLFLFVSLCGIFTNTAISIFTTGLLNDVDNYDRGLLFIFVENSMLLVAVVIWAMVSSVPDIVGKSINWAKRISHEIQIGKNLYNKSFWNKSRFVKKSDFEFDLNRRRANTIQH